MSKEFLYNQIANSLAGQIKSGVFKPGDRLPSVRNLCQEHGIGSNTAKRVFMELEAQSLVDTKPQSGYYVKRRSYRELPLPEVSRPTIVAREYEPNKLLSMVYSNMGRNDLTLFSIAAPSGALLPLAKLKKEIANANSSLIGGGTEYELVQGNVNLRRMVAVRSLGWGGNLSEDDIITTGGGMQALSFCLMAIGKPGDTIAIESPCYPGILQLVTSLNYKVIELPTHPVTGVEIEGLKRVIDDIDICLLIPNFNTPLGCCMPDENKKEIVSLLSRHNIPLIEDDVYGDLYFGSQRPKCCKAFDTEGNIIWCSSVSKTLAPGYRVGWIAPGKYKDEIMRMKLVHAISSTTIVQEAVANFIKTGKYESHLRQFRRTLESNCTNYIDAISEFFPKGTKISRPQGGLTMWVELDENIDTIKLYDLLIKQGISIAPGRMFSLQEQFHNCLRLCIGLPWSNDLKLKLKQIGSLASTNYVKNMR
ncbi:transcriptional regulator, GntR family [Mucilaginibacter lappiensis]|uniref:DNA-binding transcriptional MocR family regulator n=1 Tax=Mucilaginibacter lappiensis TaxID=354630 RepID=A0ABR6PDL1_9SPHI|nr:PLP-dependent aminotransferase family protein [Mucilaginibacter lappiensis]MBB6107846.1 DNA-binding transcriptional MocR family regulator [Mucilaginibacter lappiensis]SIP95158.1 transcriptional regulator, GntR family [Mucilaginibacter lappiensis]